MWPKKKYQNGTPVATGLLELEASGLQPQRTKQKKSCNFDKEYYKQVISSLCYGMGTFPANKIVPDGRVIRQYGINKVDVTHEYIGDKKKIDFTQRLLGQRNQHRTQKKTNLPKPFHIDSLGRRISLEGTVIKNEVSVVDELIDQQLKRSREGRNQQQECSPRLNNVRRKSMEITKRVQYFSQFKVAKRRPSILTQRAEFCAQQSAGDFSQSVPLPAISGRKPTRCLSDNEDAEYYHRENQAYQSRRNSDQSNHSCNLPEDMEQVQVAYKFRGAEPLKRKLPSGQIRKKHLWDQGSSIMNDAPSEDASQGNDRMMINMTCKFPGNCGKAKRARDTGTHNSYLLRKEYGKNLERNWFKSFMHKSAPKKKAQSQPNKGFGFRLDIFYSPEPNTDEEGSEPGENEQDVFQFDETADSMQCAATSSIATELEGRARMGSFKRSPSVFNNFAIPVEEGSDQGSSGSDIEIVLKNHQLIQRKTKHKMQKKRKRQLQRYKPFLPPTMEHPPESKAQDVPLTDSEIRALRLNLRKRNRPKKLRGKRRFLQAANAVFAAVQFKKLLMNIRKKKKVMMRKKQQRIVATLSRSKRLTWKQQETDVENETEQEGPKTPTLKDKFMKDVGKQLIKDIAKLSINAGDHRSAGSDSNDSDDEVSEDDFVTEVQPVKTRRPKKLSKFEAEVKKISKNDIELMDKNKPFAASLLREHRPRSNSVPTGQRPKEFRFTVVDKPKRKRDRSSKSNNRYPNPRRLKRSSSPLPKCSCNRSRHADALHCYSNISHSSISKCPHPHDDRPKVKTFVIPTEGLYRTYSLGDLTKMKPIELSDMLQNIDIPAKEVRLQILNRKFARQRRKRQQIRLPPVEIPESKEPEPMTEEMELNTDSDGSDVSMQSDYGMYGCPKVSSGVAWHQTRSRKKREWTEEDVEQEMKRLTALFQEMKECRYLRLNSFCQALVEKVNETEAAGPVGDDTVNEETDLNTGDDLST